jgi:archaellum component FlaC
VDVATATDDRVAVLERQLKQWKGYADQISKSKAVVDSRVLELEAEAVRDSANTDPSDTVRATLAVRVSELEAQAKKDKTHLDAIMEARTVLQARVYELENSVTKAEANGVDIASATDDRVAALETQLKRLKTYAEQLTKSKAAVDGRVLELEAEAVNGSPRTDSPLTTKVCHYPLLLMANIFILE